jgi:glycosyltransferase involved in cell wall biosynthesis
MLFLLLYVAKFMPLKQQSFLVEVMKHLPSHYKLVMVGPLVGHGPLKSRDQSYLYSIKKNILNSGLTNRIKIKTGFIEHPEFYMKCADVFCFPSDREAFGTPVIEALACGVPVMANDIPGVFDQVIIDGENGFIRPLDPQKWSASIKKLVRFSKDKRESDIISNIDESID